MSTSTSHSGTKQRVTLVGGVVNLLLGIGKIIAGYLGQSHSLIADGVHSLSDLISDAVVLAAARIGGHGPDRNHPYGHARIETAATVGIGALLLAIAAGLILNTGQRLLEPDTLWQPGWLALIAALVSVGAKEALFHYTRNAARRAGSALLDANAWHHRSDALSSIVVLIGVGGAMLGLPWLDAVGAIVVAAMIARMGWQFCIDGLAELVDTGVEEERLASMEEIIRSVEGVRGHHGLRTRRMGGEVLMDVHVEVAPEISITEAHQIGERVRHRLLESVEDVADVLVHVDPDSPHEERTPRLPSRSRVMDDLEPFLRRSALDRRRIQVLLHYGEYRIDVDVMAPPDAASEKARRILASASDRLPWLGRIRVLQDTE